MFAVGHMSIAYLLGKASGKILHVTPNVPLLMVLSILPDVDIIIDLLANTDIHRGPTHSITLAVLAFIPFFIIYRKRAIPYFLALISHSLIGDYFIGGQLQLFWPFTPDTYGITRLWGHRLNIYSPINVVLEVSLFIVAMLVLFKSSDWKVFFKGNKTNLVLIIPIMTVLLPSTIGYPFSQSLILQQPVLAVAHLFYLVLFSIAVFKTFVMLYHLMFKQSISAKPVNLEKNG